MVDTWPITAASKNNGNKSNNEGQQRRTEDVLLDEGFWGWALLDLMVQDVLELRSLQLCFLALESRCHVRS